MDLRCSGDTMKNAVRRVLILSALMAPPALQALGLGDIRLKSALNQPFDAEIELVSATPDELSALRASLASSDAFSRYGLDRPGYLSDFNFRVAKGAGGRDVLRVTSARPVTEPFVTMLVEASWDRGRLLREYTVLLDPPVFAPNPRQAEQEVVAPSAASRAPAVTRDQEPQYRAPAEPRRPRPARATNAVSGSTYRVRPNDTLWAIAQSVRPGSRSEVNRAMVALYQKNPESFDGNINVLRSGSVLRIPAAGEIEAISASQASAEVARQYQMWKSGTSDGAAASAGRLRLVTPEQGTAVPSTATAPTAAPAPAPAAAASNAANADIAARISRLETELAEARRLLEVRNAELNSMQSATSNPAPVPAADATAPAVAPGATPPPAVTENAAATAPAPAAVEAPKPVEATPPPPAPVAAAEPSLFERLKAFWWVPLALLAAALGALLLKRMRANRESAEVDLEEALASDLRKRSTLEPRASVASHIVVEEKRGEAISTPKPAIATPVAKSAAVAPAVASVKRKPGSDEPKSAEAGIGDDAGDVLSESDFHMAYGLYDQAADLVQVAIKRDPRRRDLKLKLIEIFFVWGNKEKFVGLARELHASAAQGNEGEWDRIVIMGKQIAADDPLFSGPTAAVVSDTLDMELHGGTLTAAVDLSAETTQTPVKLPESAVARAPGDTGLDFVLDEPVRTGGGVAPTVETLRLPPEAEDNTEELPIDTLGLDARTLQDLESLGTMEMTMPPTRKARTEETVITPVVIPPVETPAVTSPLEDMLSPAKLAGIESDATVQVATAKTTPMKISTELHELARQLDTVDEVPEIHIEGLDHEVDFAVPDEQNTLSEVGTKLDLARAYLDMGDPDGARSILEEVLKEGHADQRQEAQRMLASLPSA